MATFQAEGLAEVHDAVAFHLPFRAGYLLRSIGIPVSDSTVTLIIGAFTVSSGASTVEAYLLQVLNNAV